MEQKKPKIYIVGAGISGLIAAKVLQEHGMPSTILEASSSAGGRVKTDAEHGVLYDHGFQVLLTAYPEAKKHLDYKGLQLHKFKPGALIFNQGKAQRIGDPLRDFSAFLPTLLSSVGSLKDIIKIFTLTRMLKAKSIAAIFSEKEQTTLAYLKNYGFSKTMINNFFKPFFTGIFLEEKLDTSSRLFAFIFKMFGEGYAALPNLGIGSISLQLASNLSGTAIKYDHPVAKITGNSITLKNGETMAADAVISTIPIEEQTGEVNLDKVTWKSCDNLYFTVPSRVFEEGIIALVSDATTYINNLYYPFGQTCNDEAVLSVTVVKKHDMEETELVKKVKEELLMYCDISTSSFLRNYHIKQALPDISNATMLPSTQKIKNKNGVFLAGDYQLSGSLNAAMASGEAVAKAVINQLKER